MSKRYPQHLKPRKTFTDRLVTYLLTWVIGATVAWMAAQQYGPALETAFK